MFRPARPRLAPPPAGLDRGARRTLALAFAAAAAAVCGCCATPYDQSPYGGGVPGYYGQPAPYQPQPGAQPYGAPQYGTPRYVPQPVPGQLPRGGTILGPPSDGGVPALPAPGADDPYGFPSDFDNLDDEPTYDGGFGEYDGDGFGNTPTGGAPPDSGGPFYDGDNRGFGTTPTGPGSGGGDLPPPVQVYPDAFDSTPSPGGVQDLDSPPPPGDTPFDGFQDPLPEDISSTGPADPGRRRGPTVAAPLPPGAARPLLTADQAARQAAARGRGPSAPQFDPAVRAAGAAQPAGPPAARPAGPRRTVTGVVAHDAATNAWTLTYAVRPEPGDRFGGALTLIDDGHLAGWEHERNLIVSVDGRVDPAAGPDATGKPRFRVASATERGYYEGP